MTAASSPRLSTTPARQRVAFGVTLALVSVLFWGSNAVIIRHLALEGVSMSVVAFLRVAIGDGVVTAYVLLTIVLTMGNAALFLHERVTSLMLLGTGCICAALFTLVAAPRVPSTTPDSLSGRAGTVERIRVHPSTHENRKHT